MRHVVAVRKVADIPVVGDVAWFGPEFPILPPYGPPWCRDIRIFRSPDVFCCTPRAVA